MKIHKAILIQPSDEYMVRVWDSQEPKEGLKSTCWHSDWLDSYKDFEVHPDYVDRFKALEQGIDLDPDLIEIKNIYNFFDGYYTGTCHLCKNNFMGYKRQFVCKECCDKRYAILKDKQVESEDDVWSALENDMFNSFINWDLLKQKYTLKRK